MALVRRDYKSRRTSAIICSFKGYIREDRAKVVHWFSIPKEERKAFSMADIKTINHNALLLDRFILMFAIKPNILKNNQNVKELLLYGTKAA